MPVGKVSSEDIADEDSPQALDLPPALALEFGAVRDAHRGYRGGVGALSAQGGHR